MSELNNYRYKNEFYKNLSDAVEALGPNVETDEYENFLINGKELLPEAQLIREKNRILLNFTHLQGQTFDFIKHNDIKDFPHPVGITTAALFPDFNEFVTALYASC